MSNAASQPWPTELRLHKDRRALIIAFDNGETGIYSWDYFLALGRNREAYWQDYLDDLAGKGLQR